MPNAEPPDRPELADVGRSAGVAGLIASGAVLAALALHQVSSVWLAAVGLAAAAGAYLIALPRRQAAVRASRRDSDVDVQ